MKKIFALALALALPLGLAACDWLGKPEPPQPTQAETTAEPETATEIPPVTLYLPNENADGFVTRQAKTDGAIADVVALLVAEGALPEGCAPLSFMAGNRSGHESAKLDMNAAFGTAVSSTGTTGEYLLFGCLVNTVLVYYGYESVVVTAEGRVIESGHAVYDEPLWFYENQVAMQ